MGIALQERSIQHWRLDMRIFALVASVSVSLVISTSASADPCQFHVYQPESLVDELTASLPATGIAVVNLNRSARPTNTRSLLIRDGMIVGELYASVDPRAAKSEMTVLSAAGDVLMHFEAGKGRCRDRFTAGLCSYIEGYTELEGLLDGSPAYAVYTGPDGAGSPHYFRYDAPVGRLPFRRALISAFDWLTTTLDATDVTREPLNATMAERFYWHLGSLPAVAPYVHRLRVSDIHGRLVVRGVVPSNFVYDAIVRAAIDAGMWDIQPDLIIDTGTEILGPQWTLSQCY
jgi:hypothetical protein